MRFSRILRRWYLAVMELKERGRCIMLFLGKLGLRSFPDLDGEFLVDFEVFQ